METTIHYLYSRAYMGHKVLNKKGKIMTWQKLRDMPAENKVEVSVIDGFNKTFQLL